MINASEEEKIGHNLELAFQQAPVRTLAKELNTEWNFAVAATALREGESMIIGFNWGADKGVKYPPLHTAPEVSFNDAYKKKMLGSMQGVFLPLKHAIGQDRIQHMLYSNYCLFRSKSEDLISEEDLALSTPVFHQLLQLQQPKAIYAFSKRLHARFIQLGLAEEMQTKEFPSHKRSLLVSKGILVSGSLRIPIYFLPHPDAKYTSVARKSAWDFIFNPA